MSRALFIAAVCGLMLQLVGCGATTRTEPPTPMNPTAPAPAAPKSPVMPVRDPTPHAPSAVKVAHTSYGRALVDSNGFALYLFTRDGGQRTSTCAGACAAAWPPYIVHGRDAVLGPGLGIRRLGTIRRRDGRRQLTYNGHPLYYYIGDTHPGVILCQAVAEFGGTWYVIDPHGHAITRAS